MGHEEPKRILETYLKTQPFLGSVFLTGSPGIGKTTLALCASRTFGFEPLEINASRSIRSFADVERLKDACASPVRINSLLRSDPKPTCVILDEIDGSDPHAQSKIMAWIKDPARKVPIICTGNETPSIFKRNKEIIVVRCFPPHQKDLEHLFPHVDISSLVKECQHDVRRMIHRLQYGVSDILPKYTMPPTGLGLEETFLRYQRMFGLPDPLGYRGDTAGTERS